MTFDPFVQGSLSRKCLLFRCSVLRDNETLDSGHTYVHKLWNHSNRFFFLLLEKIIPPISQTRKDSFKKNMKKKSINNSSDSNYPLMAVKKIVIALRNEENKNYYLKVKEKEKYIESLTLVRLHLKCFSPCVCVRALGRNLSVLSASTVCIVPLLFFVEQKVSDLSSA